MTELQVLLSAAGLWAVTVFGFVAALFQLHSKLDQGFQSLGSRIDETNREMAQGFRAVNGRIDETNREMAQGFRAVNGRIDALSGLLQAHIERHAG